MNTPGNAGKLFISLDQDSVGTNYNELITNRTVNDGRPHHVALVRQGTTARVYIDGVLDVSKTTSGVTNITNSATLTAGKSVCSTSSTFTGLLDEIEVFSRALSDTEVRSIFNADSAGKCKTVVPPPRGQPDFVVTGLTVTPPGTPGGLVAAGSQVRVVFNIVNQGTGAAGSATHRVRLVVQPLFGQPTDVITPISVGTGTLAPMGSQSFSQMVTIPTTTPIGIARVIVEADFGNAVAEANETNNNAEFQLTITPPVPLPGRIVASRSPDRLVAARHQPHSRTSAAMDTPDSSWPFSLVRSSVQAILPRRVLQTE